MVGVGQWVVHNQCDSGPLRKALGLPSNSPTFSQQAQHLTPCQTSTTGSSTHAMVALAEQGNPDFLNEAWNGVGLPDNWRDAAAANLPRHLGRHPFYTGQVIQLLNIEWGRVLAATSGNPSVGDAQAGVQRVSNWARAKISGAGGGCTINQVNLGVGSY
ncbi:MAG: AHH domain-containing protein [Ktedonobacteraceae bacterium]